jgi:hypothetical protein
MFKTKKQPFLELFIQNIKHLAWSDPLPQSFKPKKRGYF